MKSEGNYSWPLGATIVLTWPLVKTNLIPLVPNVLCGISMSCRVCSCCWMLGWIKCLFYSKLLPNPSHLFALCGEPCRWEQPKEKQPFYAKHCCSYHCVFSLLLISTLLFSFTWDYKHILHHKWLWFSYIVQTLCVGNSSDVSKCAKLIKSPWIYCSIFEAKRFKHQERDTACGDNGKVVTTAENDNHQ